MLSLCMPERDCLVSGCHDKKVRVFDLREVTTVQMEHQEHHKSVLSVAASHDYIYSASEDTTVCVWDRRNNALLQRLNVRESRTEDQHSLSYNGSFQDLFLRFTWPATC